MGMRLPGAARTVTSVALAVAGLALTGCAGGSGDSPGSGAPAAGPSAPSRAVGTRTDNPLPAAVAQIPLRDSVGRTHTLSSFRGKVLVISDSMTLCQETCPLDTASMVETARAVDRAGLGDKVELLTITVDPGRDNPGQLAAYRKLYAPAPANWLTLTGSQAGISQVWKTLGVYRLKVPDDPGKPPRNWHTGQPLTYDIEHSDEVFFFDPDLHERFVLEGPPNVTGKAVPASLYRFMSAKGHQNLLRPSASAWTVPQALQAVGWLAHHEIGAAS